MHVALIMDEERLEREHAALNRLTIGLIGEGVQLTRIVPETFLSQAGDEREQRVALAAKLQTQMRVLPWMRRDRVERLAEAMEKGTPDVLYALGERAWDLGMDLAKALRRPLMIDVWRAVHARRAPRGRRASVVACYTATTRPLAEALRQRVDPGLICLVPPGVALPKEPRSILTDPDNAIALAIIGGGRDVATYRGMLGGLARVVRQMPQVQAFLELCGPNEHEIWRTAQRLELLANLSAITDAAQHRSLLTRCDVLIMPEQLGELRSLMLEAMAFGMPVIAREDPFLEKLIDDESAYIIRDGHADEWAEQLSHLLTHPDEARALGLAARQCIADNHRSSDQAASLIEAFQRIMTGGAYPFEPHAD